MSACIRLKRKVRREAGLVIGNGRLQYPIGETIKFLRDTKKRHGREFEDRVNVDLHSCGGWSVESWVSEVSPAPVPQFSLS